MGKFTYTTIRVEKQKYNKSSLLYSCPADKGSVYIKK